MGATVDHGPADDLRTDAVLFGEAQSRIAFSTTADDADRAERLLSDHPGIGVHRVGTVGGDHLRMEVGGATLLNVPVDRLATTYESAIPDKMNA